MDQPENHRKPPVRIGLRASRAVYERLLQTASASVFAQRHYALLWSEDLPVVMAASAEASTAGTANDSVLKD